MGTNGLRNGAIITFVVSLVILLAGGYYAKSKIPPIPQQITSSGAMVASSESIMRGQDTYQQYGLMDHGSVWGHGSLRGPDFSATTLHFIGQVMRDFYAAGGTPVRGGYQNLSDDDKRIVDAIVIAEIKKNRYDPSTGSLELTPAEDFAVKEVRDFWETSFGKGNGDYGFLPNTIPTAQQRSDIADFFFWTAWAAGTDRPGLDYTYTNNWPADESVGNGPSANAFLWTLISIIALLVILGLIVYIVHRYQFFYGDAKGVEVGEKLANLTLTPSQIGSAKFFLVAGLLFVLQLFNGALLAHYTVHPGTFYMPFIAKLVPYSWAKTWHLQLAILWIALSWMGTAILLAPMISRREPKGQKHFVNILFVAAFLVAVGSLIGEALSIKGLLGDKLWFWFGHQGWEYLELGKIWQILLFGGLLFWLVVVYRPMANIFKPGDKKDEDKRALVIFYLFSAVFVVLFFGFGLFYGRGTHLSIADYWRWFVVHIWVESIFEFFGVAVTALFLVALGLVTPKSALRVAYLTGILVFLSGIPGTAHHYYWYGGPSLWLAIGGVFSSLEPIPLILLVTRAWMEYKSIHEAGKDYPYRWPLLFLTASAFWNFLGAGVFGFLINLPIINYYEHATYLTANHAHTALFGVYGMLAISLILFSWRSMVQKKYWNTKLLNMSFWALNGGLFLMFLTSLLPVGLMQVWDAFTNGLWHARSGEFYRMPAVQFFGQWRMVPDIIIIFFGAIPLLWFLVSTYLHLRPCSNVEGECSD